MFDLHVLSFLSLPRESPASAQQDLGGIFTFQPCYLPVYLVQHTGYASFWIYLGICLVMKLIQNQDRI